MKFPVSIQEKHLFFSGVNPRKITWKPCWTVR